MLVVLQADGAAVDGHALVTAAGDIKRRLGTVLLIDLDVVGYIQIEIAVAVVIHKSSPGAKMDALVDEPCFFRNIGKGAIAVVAIQLVLPVVSDEEVFVAVIVVVA